MLRAQPCRLVFEPSSSRVDLIERDFFAERGGGRGANAQRRLPALEWSTVSVFGGSGGLGGPRRLFSISSAVAATEKKPLACSRFPPLGSWLSFAGRWHGVSTSKDSDEGAGASRLVSGACQTRGMGAAEVLHDDLPSSAILSPPSQQPRPLSSTALSSSSKTKNRPATPPPAPVSSSTAPTAPCEFVFSVVYFGGRFIFFVFECLRRDPRPPSALPIKSLS
jgi:hypothetical protein